jgi:hypothetical protein
VEEREQGLHAVLASTENLKLLADAMGLDLELAAREKM